MGHSLFGLEHFGERPTEGHRQHGYNLLRFDLSGTAPSWRRWPRRAYKKAGGYWRIERDVHAEHDLESDGGTPAKPFGRTRPWQAPSPRPIEASAGTARPVVRGDDRSDPYERLRSSFDRTLAVARRITSGEWQRLGTHVLFGGQRLDLRVEANGDGAVSGIYSVQSSQAVPFVPYEIVADEVCPPVEHLEDLDFQVSLLAPKQHADEVIYLQTDNFPRRKRVLLYFLPPIDSRPRKVKVTYRWPRLFAKLVEEGQEELVFEWRRAVTRGEIRVRFAPGLGEVRCRLVSGLTRGIKLARVRDPEGYLEWRCTCRDAPAGDYQLSLERPGDEASR